MKQMISIEKLAVGYGKRRLVEDATTGFRSARLTALLGRNGAGKSTLLRVLAGLDAPISGEVRVGDRPLADMSAADKARTIAFVTTQRVRIANMLCRDVVAMGRAPYTNWIGRMRDEDSEAVARSLRLVGMEDFAGRTLDSMSDGECQRVMIARALAQDTPVILLDEPTSFLDLPNRYELCTLLSRLAHEQHKCIIFSTHELDIALQLCDDIALIDTPHLYHMQASEMAASGCIERLFSSACIEFDPIRRQVILK